MFDRNVAKVLSEIKPSDIVLDIGGWAQPFKRANYVLDAFPYETRGYYRNLGLPDSIGNGEEQFTKETWIQADICDRKPFPFEDKSIDYVICSHVLEDVRDPLWVCSEIMRIGKRGYIEVPSRMQEFIYDENTKIAGCPHHRWLVDIKDRSITFEMKWHFIHKKGMHLPGYVQGVIAPEKAVQWMFWDKPFEYKETDIPLGESVIEERLRTFVQEMTPQVSLTYRWVWKLKNFVKRLREHLPAFIVNPMNHLWKSYKTRLQHDK